MQSFKSIGILDTDSVISVDNWPSLIRQSLEKRLGTMIPQDSASILSALSDIVPPSDLPALIEALDFLSLLPSSSSRPSLPTHKFPQLPIHHFTTLLARKLRYESHERDLVVLSHEIVTESASSPSTTEVHTSSLVTYGTSKASAMSLCVGLPVAFAALRVLDGGVDMTGVAGPTEESVYGAVLKGLEEVGLGMKESMKKGTGMEGVLRDGLLTTSDRTLRW
jgi:alpha-aminoadipic semialdehyde synthase